MSKLIYFLVPIGIILSGVTFLNSRSTSHTPSLKGVSGHLSVISSQQPAALNFCGDRVPLANQLVKENMDREIRKNAYYSTTRYLLKRADRYKKSFLSILREEGIPDDFFYLAVAESHLSNAISPVGARGFWQFMRTAGQHYGLEISSTVDERFHPEKATRAAAKYIKDEYKYFQDWSLVAAAYNMGSPRLVKAIEAQDTESYFELKLNKETSRYLYRVLAMKTIMENPKQYGVSGKVSYKPIQTYSVRVSSPIKDLAAFAHENGATYRDLKNLNPWLISDHLNPSPNKTYEIHFPLNPNPEAYELVVSGTTLPEVIPGEVPGTAVVMGESVDTVIWD